MDSGLIPEPLDRNRPAVDLTADRGQWLLESTSVRHGDPIRPPLGS